MNNKSAVKSLYRDKRRRVWELDFLRGFAVIAMCFDHLMFDCSHPYGFFSDYKTGVSGVMDKLYGFARIYWDSTIDYGFRFWAHYLFVFLFLFLVGISCALSRDNVKRGALCGIAAIAFTGISFVCKAIGFMDDGIVFGILHCIALCILCVAAIDNITKFNKRVNLYAPLAIGAAVLLAGILNRFWTIRYDRVFTNEHFTGYVIGTFAFGDDWFGLFPYVGAVCVGMYFGKAVYSAKQSLLPMLDGKWHKPVTFVGRHALWFYFFHQPVLAGLYIVLGLIVGFSL